MSLRYAVVIAGFMIANGCASGASDVRSADVVGDAVQPYSSQDELATHSAPADPERAGLGLTERLEADIRYELAGALMEEKAYPEALEHYKWLRQRQSTWWVAHLEYARASYFLEGNASDALDALRSAVLLKPVNPRAYLLMGQIYDDEGEWKKAEIAYRQILKWRPEEEKAAMQLARLRARQNDGDEAAQIYEDVLRLNDRNLQALLGLAALQEARGDHKEAERLYLRCQDVHPDTIRAFAIVIGYYKRNNRTQELARTNRALERELERSKTKKSKGRRGRR